MLRHMENKLIRGAVGVVIREFDPEKDGPGVEEVERSCEVGPPGQVSLFTDLLGDPIARIRHSPSYLMLVAEKTGGHDDQKIIVGMIRGCIKTVAYGGKIIIKNDTPICTPVYAQVAYILGLRVSPSNRGMGIGLRLVQKMEEWFIQNGAEYSYIATENDNQPSLNLFILKCNYVKFRTPSILVQPVHAHQVKINNQIKIIKLNPLDAEILYRTRFSTVEFFPNDIGQVLTNKLNLGTYVAVPVGSAYSSDDSWPGSCTFLAEPPGSWAVLSIWNSKDVFTLEIKGACLKWRLLANATRLVDKAFPWLGIPSMPQVFKPFGLLFLYGLGGEGPLKGKMVEALCWHAHNVARDMGCGVVAAEVAKQEPLRRAIPHWKRLSCEEDVWCIKRLVGGYSDGPIEDWANSKPGLSLFVDPREF